MLYGLCSGMSKDIWSSGCGRPELCLWPPNLFNATLKQVFKF